MDQDRDEGGQFDQKIRDEDILEAMEVGEPYTSGELADMVGLTRRSVTGRMNDLADAGEVVRKKPNQTTIIWLKTE